MRRASSVRLPTYVRRSVSQNPPTEAHRATPESVTLEVSHARTHTPLQGRPALRRGAPLQFPGVQTEPTQEPRRPGRPGAEPRTKLSQSDSAQGRDRAATRSRGLRSGTQAPADPKPTKQGAAPGPAADAHGSDPQLHGRQRVRAPAAAAARNSRPEPAGARGKAPKRRPGPAGSATGTAGPSSRTHAPQPPAP